MRNLIDYLSLQLNLLDKTVNMLRADVGFPHALPSQPRPALETSTTIKHSSAKRNMPKFVHFYNVIMFQMKTQPAKNVKWKDNKEMSSIFRLEFECINSPSVNQLWSNDPREALQTWASFIPTSISSINLHSQDRSSNYALSVEHLQEWHLPRQTELCPWRAISADLHLLTEVMGIGGRKGGWGGRWGGLFPHTWIGNWTEEVNL